MHAKAPFPRAGLGTAHVAISSQWPLVARPWLLSHTSEVSEVPLENKTSSQGALNSEALHCRIWKIQAFLPKPPVDGVVGGDKCKLASKSNNKQEKANDPFGRDDEIY